ncbi:MAG: 30S ribosomal protein S12 methylthiotransferase RimO [Bacillota bacterium]|jgi:ribosomal protein S12 methylthiotransferase
MNNSYSIYLRSLGCAKNLVDSEIMSGLLAFHDFNLTENAAEAQVIILNTCAFIQEAKEEAIENILALAQYKQNGKCQLLIVTGCLIEKYRQEVLEALPEIDAVLGTSEYQKIAELISEKLHLTPPARIESDPYLFRRLSTPSHTAYLKIADGCDNHCSYCLIPQLRGAFYSRPLEDIFQEAKALRKKNVQELVIIAQDSTNYGSDLYGRPSLAPLLERLAQLDFKWIRLLYVYPDLVDEQLLKVMAAHKNICHYLDIPLQHADNKILKAMNRRGTVEESKAKIALIRRYLPDIALRTTMMVGFPGETKASVAQMVEFLQEMQFDWVGVFKYCREADTVAARMPSQVKKDAKLRREHKIMTLQAGLTHQRLKRHLGQVLEVLVEGPVDGLPGWYEGRSQYHAPEVDGLIYFSAENLSVGQFVQVKITAVEIYDLIGEVL